MRESVPCFSDESIKDKGAAFERNLVLFVVLELLIPLLPSFTAAMLLLESSPEIITNFYYTFGRSWNLLIYFLSYTSSLNIQLPPLSTSKVAVDGLSD